VRLVLNVIWVLFGGIWLWLLYLVAGVIACVTIIGIPFGLAAFRIGWYALWPFGRTVVDHPAAGVASTVGNVLWLLVFGWWLALGHLTTAIAQALTIIGIPLALGNLKMVPVSLFPLGKRIVPAGGNSYSTFGPDVIGPGPTGSSEDLRLR
jgi:uncharacterized membrane protein YccF (DUF307 family)